MLFTLHFADDQVITAEDEDAVSYTHLDVYKRQVIARSKTRTSLE